MAAAPRSRTLRRTAALATAALVAQLLVLAVAPAPVSAADAVLTGIDITAPNLVGDSNVLAQPTQGPDSFFITAEFCNTGATHDLDDVVVYVGDGTTPGIFPLNSPPAGAPYTSSHSLSMVSGIGNDEIRWIGTLPAGGVPGTDDPDCSTQHWIVQYDAVGTDAGGNPEPLWGASNSITDDFVYDYTFWGQGTDAGDLSTVTFASTNEHVTVRNEITAAPNKIQPTGNPAGFTIITDTASPQVGQEVVVQFNNVTFGNPNQGFDDDGDGFEDYDLWFQPIGEAALWDADVFRLVRVEASITGSQCGGGRPDVTLNKVDDTYFKGLDAYGGCKWDGTYEYRFMALQPGASRLAPYQEVASGNDNEKYNNDYCGDTGATATDPAWDPAEDICVLLTVTGGTTLDIDKSVDQAYVNDLDTLTWTIPYQNTGSVDAGSALSKVWIEDSIPANTSYTAGSAACTVPYAVSSPACTVTFSTNNGLTYSTTEPVDPTTVTDVRWILEDPVPAGAPTGSACSTAGQALTGACSVTFQTTVDSGFKGTVVNLAQIRMEGGPPLDTANAQSCSVCFDFGDAPASYGTLSAANGARHLRTGGPAANPTLGAAIDTDRNGVPAVAGNQPLGDDTDTDGDDEEGVSVPAINGATTNTVTVIVNDASAGGTHFFNGWIDFDNNGTFDADESILGSGVFVSATAVFGSIITGEPATVTQGVYQITFNAPDFAANGSNFSVNDVIYSRFRVSNTASEVQNPTGLALSGEVEDYGTDVQTLPVTLASVDARKVGKDIVVDWTTADEVENLGFDILVDDGSGGLVAANDELIASQNPTSLEPADYSTRIRSGADEIWIRDVALDGTENVSGPFEVGRGYGRPAEADARIDWAQARSEVRAATPATPGTTAGRTASGTVGRIEVDTTGLQELTYDDLLAAGIDLTGARSRDLAVLLDGAPVDAIVTGPARVGAGTVVQFWGEAADTLYTGTNVYHLAVDRSLAARASTVGGKPRARGETATTHRATVTVEHQRTYSVSAPGDDPWYDRILLARPGRPRAVGVPVDLPGHVGGGEVAVDVWGVSDLPGTVHHVTVAVNGTPVGETSFEGTDAHTITANVPDGVLVDGVNTVTVTNVGDSGAAIDLVALDAVQVTHDRRLEATSDAFTFEAAGNNVAVSGLAGDDVTVLRHDGTDTAVLRNVAIDGGTATFRISGDAADYTVLTDDGTVHPTVSPARATVDLLAGPADYLVVGNGALLDGLAPLVAHHESLGRSVKVVDVADVYEQYNHGVVDASAIDAYLADAVPALGTRWVLLVGADTYDYRDYDGDGSFSLLPSPYGSTGLGIEHAPLDPAYADVDDDDVPDVALGRFTARTPAELDVLVAKTLAYAGTDHGGRAVIATDAADSSDYAAIGDELEGLLSGASVTRADIDRLGVDGARAALLDGLAAGAAVTTYLGHTSTAQWSDDRLLTRADASALVNAPTVALQFGCWNTYYVLPRADGLSDALLRNPNGGAAAVLGGTTLTSAANDAALARLVMARLADPSTTVGEAVLAAKRDLASTHAGALDVQLGWTTLGDPAIAVGGLG